MLHKTSATGTTISSESYVYDAADNLSSKTVDDGDKLTSIAQGGTTVKSYGYDAAGRTTSVASSAGTTTLGYDYEGRVASISGPGVSNTFTYNGLDTRVGKVDSAGTSTYRRDGGTVTSSVLSDGSAIYTAGVSQRRGGATTYDLLDRLGTANRQTNSSAATVATRVYDAFGVLVSATGTPQGPFGFVGSQGYQEDGDSGLKLLGHRYYDPSTGRFLTRDPNLEGRNWYVYSHSSPHHLVDPTGYGPFYPPNMGFNGDPTVVTLSKGTVVWSADNDGIGPSDYFAPTSTDVLNAGLPPWRQGIKPRPWILSMDVEVFVGEASDATGNYDGQGGKGGGTQFWSAGPRLSSFATATSEVELGGVTGTSPITGGPVEGPSEDGPTEGQKAEMEELELESEMRSHE